MDRVDWLPAARRAGLNYRHATADPRVRHLAQAGPAIIVGSAMRVAGEDGHVVVGQPGTVFTAVAFRHPGATNED